LRLPCRVWSPHKTFSDLLGVTKNISRTGVLVLIQSSGIPEIAPKVGEEARLFLDLPHSANFEPRCLDCATRVVRVSALDADAREIAFEIEKIRVCGRDAQPEAVFLFPELAGGDRVQ